MRPLTQQEIDNAPEWANYFHIPHKQAPSYSEFHHSGYEPIPRKEFDISDCKHLSRFDHLKFSDRLLEVGHNKYESLFFGRDQIIEAGLVRIRSDEILNNLALAYVECGNN